MNHEHTPEPCYFDSHSEIDQFAAAIAGLANPGMSAEESLEHFLLIVPESADAAEHLLEEKTRAFGLSDAEDLSLALHPLIAHHLREFWGKGILPRA